MRFQLLRGDRNDVFRAIQRVGLDPNHFEWQSVKTLGEEYTQLVFSPDTRCCFRFKSAAEWFPPRGVVDKSSQVATSVEELLSLATKKWLPELARHYSQPDLWASLNAENQLLHAAIVPHDSPIEPEERQRIDEALSAFEARLLQQFGANSTVQAEIAALRVASQTFSRKDWLTLALGALINIACAIHQQPIRDLVDWFAQALHDAAPRLLG